uniref:Glycosyl transferase family 1 domain-containing protein n=1 Tax=viral metagenome TaxID=1070528 RepID=A0A6C0K5T6_9ZZZZ
MTIIGFLSNKLTLRGTEIAMYDYADYNETMLKNKSIIITRNFTNISNEFDANSQAYKKFNDRFSVFYYSSREDIDTIVQSNDIRFLYIIKGGSCDNLYSLKCKNLIHVVFHPTCPHGEIYSVISNDVNKRHGTNYPVVPHMIRIAESNDDMRDELNIPQQAIVFGRYGGKETFDITFVHDVIKYILNERNDIYFIFMNTDIFYNHPNIIYLDGTTDMIKKRKFINTCNALLHARIGGETFGLSCGEFAISLKPVITYGLSTERNHLDILGEHAIIYDNFESLYHILNDFHPDVYTMNDNGYLFYTPENIMNIFKCVYLTNE